MSKTANLLALFICGLVLAMTTCSLRAQETRATLTGRVTDSSGSAMPNVVVEATNVATNTTASCTTNEQGDYVIPYILPGTYNLRARATGFKTFVRQSIDIHIGDQIQIDIPMEIGQQSQRVTVTATTPLLQTASSSVGQVIDQRSITELPDLHANVFLLAQQSPAVLITNTSITWVTTSAGANADDTLFNLAGSPSSTQDVTIDGGEDTTTSAGAGAGKRTVAFIPPADAIAEFKVETAVFDASSGFSTGGWMATNLKSGTNTFHGTVDYWQTNVGWNANDFFANEANEPRAILESNHQVASASGPVYIPKVYDGRSKTFFMYAFEREYRSSPSGVVDTVPTAAEKQGNFSALLNISPTYQIYNPFSATSANGVITRQPFANNVIPTSMFSPTATNMLAYYPSPLTSGTANGTNNYPVPNTPSTLTMTTNTARVDHDFNERHRLFVHAYYGNRPDHAYDYYGTLATGVHSNFGNRGALVDDVYTISPRMLLSVRYAFCRFLFPDQAKSEGMNLTTLGFPASLMTEIDSPNTQFPTIEIGGLSNLGSNTDSLVFTNDNQVAGELTWERGKHTIEFGVDKRWYGANFYSNLGTAPTFDFTTAYTQAASNSTASPDSVGQGMAAFLLGIPTSGTITKTASAAQLSSDLGPFVQDNWRVTKKLMLNLGVRYELEGAYSERFNRSVRGFDTTTVNALNAQVSANYALNPLTQLPANQFSVQGGLLYEGVSGQPHTLYDTQKANFAPRVGFAYQIMKDTVIRGGYGVFYGFVGQQRNLSVIQTGFSQVTNFEPTLNGGLSFVATLDNPFPSGLLQPTGSSLGLNTYMGNTVSFFDSNPRTPFNQIWQMTVQRSLPWQSFIELGYIGNEGQHIIIPRYPQYFPAQDLSTLPTRDQTAYSYWTTNVPNPFYPLLPGTSLAGSVITRYQEGQMAHFPQFAEGSTFPATDGVADTESVGLSWYNALTARFQKRFGYGFALQINYTQSKLLQAQSRLNGQGSPLERVVSADDRPYSLTMSGVYELPVGTGKRFTINNRFANAIVGDWRIGIIPTFQGGPALAFGDALLTSSLSGIALPVGQRTVQNWFNTSAFNTNTTQQLAYNYETLSSRLSGVRGQGLNMWNGSLRKPIKIYERFRIMVDADVANMFNHPNFSVPNTTPTSSAFGTVTSSAAYARTVQLGAQVAW